MLVQSVRERARARSTKRRGGPPQSSPDSAVLVSATMRILIASTALAALAAFASGCIDLRLHFLFS
jgi:hypothetical protein